MYFDIKVLTNVEKGGTPDVGDVPTDGLLSNLIESITSLSDELALNKDIIEIIIERNGRFYLGNQIIDNTIALIKNINVLTYNLQKITYGDYHNSVRPLPETLNKRNYGITIP